MEEKSTLVDFFSIEYRKRNNRYGIIGLGPHKQVVLKLGCFHPQGVFLIFKRTYLVNVFCIICFIKYYLMGVPTKGLWTTAIK